MLLRAPGDKLAPMKAYRARLLRFDNASGQPLYDDDGLLVIGPDAQGRAVVRAAGAHAATKDSSKVRNRAGQTLISIAPRRL